MNLLTAIEKFPTQESCIEHLERGYGSEMTRFVRCVVLLVSAPVKQSFAASGVGTVMPVNPASMSFPGPYFRKRAFRFRSGLWQLPSS